MKRCWCAFCDEMARDKANPFAFVRMNLCPECGNKRCPKATHHAMLCTNSNEPGQAGSAYGVEIRIPVEKEGGAS